MNPSRSGQPSSRAMYPIFDMIPSQVLRPHLSLNPTRHPQCADSSEWWAGADVSMPENPAAIDALPERLGDRCQPLDDEHVRVLFGNINRLQLSDRGTRLRQIFREIHMLNAHHTGLAEVNTNTQHSTASKLLQYTRTY
eukprot:scaffold5425_cov55-Cylindrotheca_fusiformis.AAC.1